jgi:hypothetical protein
MPGRTRDRLAHQRCRWRSGIPLRDRIPATKACVRCPLECEPCHDAPSPARRG